jgi:ABC-type dipeptide/oligopeptide/nickel transport system ATPase subunit
MPEPARRGLIVEFAGLPGVGKSTLSHAVAAALRQSGEIVTEPAREIMHDSRRNRRKLVFAARTMMRHPAASLAAVAQIFMSRQRTLRDFASTAFNFLYVCGLVANCRKEPGIHFVDQGCVNSLWSIGYSASRSPALARLVDIGKICCGGDISDLVVVVEARRQTVVARLKERPGAQSRLERGMDGANLQKEFDTAADVFRRILDFVGSHARDGQCGFQLQTIENDESQGYEPQDEAIVAVVRRAQSLNTVIA